MSLQKSKVTLSFQPRERGKDLVTIKTANSNSLFHCEQIVADFYGQVMSVSLSGFFDSGTKVKGMLRANTESKLSVLKFLERELSQRDVGSQQTGILDARKIVEAELKRVTNSLEEAKNSVREVLKIYADDFDWSRENIKKDLRMFPKRYKRSLFYELPYSSISSFLSIETFTDGVSDSSSIKKTLAERVSFSEHALRLIESQDNLIIATGITYQPLAELDDVLCYFRIREIGGQWIDVEGKLSLEYDRANLELNLADLRTGQYEATVYLRSYYTGEVLWRGEIGDNFQFSVEEKSLSEKDIPLNRKELSIRKLSFASYDTFSNWCVKYFANKGFGKYFLKSIKELPQSDQEQIFRYYSQALKNAARRSSIKSSAILKAFRLLGVSEVMMISPEGHHAMAGGLSQVIIGLSAALMQEHCNITIVTPIYHQKNGNHHDSFAGLIEQGIFIHGRHVKPSHIGHFYLEDFGSSEDAPRKRMVEVFEVKLDNLRLLFVYNKELSDRLYGGISGGDLLKRSSFLSRAALEIIKQNKYSCAPDFILTHDWSTSLVRAYQKLSDNYKNSAAGTIPLVHILHNAGIAYQGRFKVNENGIRVWENLGFEDCHLNLFLEADEITLNLSKAACILNSHGIMTVSRPYANQLVSVDDKSELSNVLRLKRDHLFGISNGIPTQAVRTAAFQDNDWSGISDLSIEHLKVLKSDIKIKVQQKYGLGVGQDYILAVLVGRLTEQKGLSLLTDRLVNGKSVLELALENCPKLQIVIAGPPSQGDQSFHILEELSKLINPELITRCKFRFEFVAHSEAIELTAAADFFLMPSKYEPGGIAQLEALAVGTSVVAHRIGGLSATLTQYLPMGKRTAGNSFLFDSFDPLKFYNSFMEAYQVMCDERQRDFIVQAAFNSRNDWADRVPYYLSMFQNAVGLFDNVLYDEGRFKASRQELLSKVSAKN